jgi:hypothetical protein
VRKLYLPRGARQFRSRQAYNLAYETEHLDDRERGWRRIRKCRWQLGSDPDGIDKPSPEKPAGMPPSRYARLIDRLDAAENDLDLPMTLGGPRFECRPDRGPYGNYLRPHRQTGNIGALQRLAEPTIANHLEDNLRQPYGPSGNREAAELLKKLLELGLSRFEPDPATAIEQAERRKIRIQ